MKGYRSYMDRQKVSPELHRRLMELEERQSPSPSRQKHTPSSFRWQPLAVAACLCLVIGGSWMAFFGRGMGSGKPESMDYALDAAASAEAPAEAEEATAVEPAAAESIYSAQEDNGLADEAPAEAGLITETELEEAAEEAIPTQSGSGEEDLVGTYGPLLYAPEGYRLVYAHRTEEELLFRWEGSDGGEITARRIYSDPAELVRKEGGLAVYDGESYDWREPESLRQEGELWGFILDWSEYTECYTADLLPEELAAVAESFSSAVA